MNFFQKLFGKKNKTPEPAVIEQQVEQSVEPQVEPVARPQTEPAKTKRGATQPSAADADVKKLTRRIRELEDDLEDAQDDAKDTNKKLERTQTEKKALKEELDRLQDELNRIKNEHNTIQTEHAYTVKDLEIKKKSVDFVNEILNAPLVSSRQVQGVTEKSTAIMNFVRDSICEAFREFYKDGKEVAARIASEIGKWENLQRKTWLKDKTVVAFIGQFSAGKTSIVNRVFTQDRKDALWTLPVSRSPTTAVATYISYGDNPKTMFTDPKDELRELPQDVFLQFTKESLDNISVSRLVSHFVTEYNTENLRRMSILDTPGFSSGDEEDERRTTAVINEADVLFWVVDIQDGDIGAKSTRLLAIIKEYAAGAPIYVVINKADTKVPSECKKIEAQMRKTLDKAKIPVKGFIPFSKEEPLEALTSIIGKLKPRRPGYDVITDIKSRLDTLIQNCQKRITKERREANDYNRAINEAESVIDAYEGNSNRLTDKWGELDKELNSSEKNFIFVKYMEPDAVRAILKQQTEVVHKIIGLDGEYADAVGKFVENSRDKEKSETEIKTLKAQKKRLENLKAEFDKKLRDFGIETKTAASRRSSTQRQE